MPIDSRDKRTSLMLFDWIVGRVLPVPTGAIGTAARRHFLGKYNGLALAGPASVVTFHGAAATIVQARLRRY